MTTAEMIEKARTKGACTAALAWLATQPDAQSAWDSCTRLDWLEWYFNRFASPEAWAEYDRVRDEAWAEYERVRAPALAEYERVRAEAWAEYDRVTAPALAEYDRVTAPALAEYDRVRDEAWAEYERVRATEIRRIMPNP